MTRGDLHFLKKLVEIYVTYTLLRTQNCHQQGLGLRDKICYQEELSTGIDDDHFMGRYRTTFLERISRF